MMKQIFDSNITNFPSDFSGREDEVPDCHWVGITVVGGDADGLSFIDFADFLESAGQKLVGGWGVEPSILDEFFPIEVDVHPGLVSILNCPHQEAHGQQVLTLLQLDARDMLVVIAIELLFSTFDFRTVCLAVVFLLECLKLSSEHFDNSSQVFVFRDSPFHWEFDGFLHRQQKS